MRRVLTTGALVALLGLAACSANTTTPAESTATVDNSWNCALPSGCAEPTSAAPTPSSEASVRVVDDLNKLEYCPANELDGNPNNDKYHDQIGDVTLSMIFNRGELVTVLADQGFTFGNSYTATSGGRGENWIAPRSKTDHGCTFLNIEELSDGTIALVKVTMTGDVGVADMFWCDITGATGFAHLSSWLRAMLIRVENAYFGKVHKFNAAGEFTGSTTILDEDDRVTVLSTGSCTTRRKG